MDENKDKLNNESNDSMFSQNDENADSMFSTSNDDSMFSQNDENADSMFSTPNDENNINEENNQQNEETLSSDDSMSIQNNENEDLVSSFSVENNINQEIIDVEEVEENNSDTEETKTSIYDEILNNDSKEETIETTEQEETTKSTPIKEDIRLSFGNIQEDINSADDSMVTVRPVKFQEFDEAVSNLTIKKNLDIMQDVPMHITVELGRTKSTIKDIVNMEIGSIVELDKIAGEQVEIFVNGKLVARGEVIVIEDKFGVRVVNTNIPKDII